MATHVVTSVVMTKGAVTGGTSVTATADGQVCVRRSGSVTFDTLTVGDVSGAASTSYVDSVAQGLDVKASVRAATTANITLSGAQTIDGVSVVAGDRVLVKNQTTGANNGIYVAAAGAWTRATDADASAEVTAGLFVFVSEGTVNGNTGWTLTTDDPITLGTTALTFTQFSGAGTYTAGTGLTLTGTSFALTSGVATPGTYASVMVDTYGRVTTGTAAAALTKTDDANVTLTLGGSPTTALVNAASITVGWTGTLTLSRGGTGANLSATGGANQFLKQTSAGGAVTVAAITTADVPALDFSKITTGTVPIAQGGTGLTAVGAADTVLVSDGSTWSAQYPPLELFAFRALGTLGRAGDRWYGPSCLKAVTPGAAVAATANKLYALRLDVPAGQTVSKVGVKQASFSVGGHFRVGIAKAADNGAPWPESILWDSGDQSTGGGTLAGVLGFTANLATAKGTLYWLLFATDNATATYESVSPADLFPSFGSANDAAGSASGGGVVRVDFTYGTLPAYLPTAGRTILDAGSGAVPKVFVQFKSPYLLYDTFSDVDAVALASHAMNYGGGWTAHVGTWEINAGKARQTNTTGGVMVATADSGSGDGTYEFDLTTAGSTDFTAGIAFRFSDTSNWWRFFASSGTGNWRLIEHTASAGGTVRATYAVAPAVATTYHVKVVLSGTSISCYVDGTLAASFTSSAQQTNTRAGLYESRSVGVNGCTFDAFKGTA